MIERIRGRLTYANVMSTLAVFLALGGGMAWALANNSVKSRHIRDGNVKNQDLATPSVNGNAVFEDTLGGRHIDESTLTEVPQATSAASAQNADNAASLGGFAAGQYLRSGQAGSFVSAGLQNSCTANDQWFAESGRGAAYWRDPFGTVHLRGRVGRCNDVTSDVILTLPAGFRPPDLQQFAVAGTFNFPGFDDEIETLEVAANGQVSAPGSTEGSHRGLDGITFRCAPSGSNGCP